MQWRARVLFKTLQLKVSVLHLSFQKKVKIQNASLLANNQRNHDSFVHARLHRGNAVDVTAARCVKNMLQRLRGVNYQSREMSSLCRIAGTGGRLSCKISTVQSHLRFHCQCQTASRCLLTHLNWCWGWPGAGQSLSRTCNGTPPCGPYMHPGCCTSTAWCLFCSGRVPVEIWPRSGPAPAPGKHKKSPGRLPCHPRTSVGSVGGAVAPGAAGPRGLRRSGSARPRPEWSFSATPPCPRWSSRSATGSPTSGCGAGERDWTPRGRKRAGSSGGCPAGRGHATGAASAFRSEEKLRRHSASSGWPGWGGWSTCCPGGSKCHCWTDPKLSNEPGSHSEGCLRCRWFGNNYGNICWGSGPAVCYCEGKLFRWTPGCRCCSDPAEQGLASCQIPPNPRTVSHSHWGTDQLTVPGGSGRSPRRY